jgi:short-subunit dehydrogenase
LRRIFVTRILEDIVVSFGGNSNVVGALIVEAFHGRAPALLFRVLRSTPKNGAVVIVTGASSGIGRALALRLGAGGYRVGLVARRRDELELVATTIAAAGGSAAVAPADVGDRPALRAAIAVIENQLGPTDVMVANAGFGAPTRLDPLNTDDVEQTIRVNILGVIYSIEAVLPGMIARKSGHLLAISSLGAFKGLPGESAYCASKAAVNAYMEGLRIALRSKGVVVTTVCPGFVETPMTPMDSAMPFMISADAAARRIARLITRRRGGVARFPLPMSLLMSLIARLPDAIVARLIKVEPAQDPARTTE